MLYGRLLAIRTLLLLPIALCLALLIVNEDPFMRAMAVVGLVAFEVVRDALSLSEVASRTAELAPKQKDKQK